MDLENGSASFYYQIKTPHFMRNRDALVEMKSLKNYPFDGACSLVQKSTTHPSHPEDYA